MNATWDIALEHCPPDGDLNGFYQALRDSLTDAFQKIDLEEFTVDPPPDWAIGFIHKYNFENELYSAYFSNHDSYLSKDDPLGGLRVLLAVRLSAEHRG